MKISLYIHIPFCVRKCLYCDFLSGPFDDKVRTRYIAALTKEISLRSLEYQNYEVISIFFGGGTPSILEGEDILNIMNVIRDKYTLQENAEISIECNPGTVDSKKLKCFKDAGINRISIGLQSSIDEELRVLGRIHTRADFENIYKHALSTGFRNVNVDLMSGLPNQSVEDYRKTLEYVTGLEPKPTHISAYSLIIEEGTPFYDMLIKQVWNLPNEDEERMMYEITADILGENGYQRYEISNYALKGFECIHNSVYWKRGNYLGFGLGASSMVNNVRWQNETDIERYIESCDENYVNQKRELSNDKQDVNLCIERQELSKEEQMEEFMFLGLRMMEGISINEFREYFNEDMPGQFYDVIEKYKAMGLMQCKNNRIMLTKDGINVSNTIFSEFLLA